MSLFNLFKKYNKTNYVGGGLLEDKEIRSPKDFIVSSPQFVAPKSIDNRSMCLETSDQGRSSECAAYSTCGFIEFQNWKTKHYPEQIDPAPVYKEAKRLDGNDNAGTYLHSATQAAINLGLISGTPKFLYNRNEIEIQFAIHQFGVCIAGFSITEEWNMVERNTGKISVLNNPKTLGGHAVLLIGYNEEGVYLQNSWSGNWGINGFALLPWQLFDRQMNGYAMVIIPA